MTEQPISLSSGPLVQNYDYQLYYKLWHSESPEHARMMGQSFANQLGPIVTGRESGRVLDIGCGMGFALLGLRQLGFSRLEGIDCDAGQVKSARNLGLDAECVTDTIEYLLRKPVQYDVVMLLDVLEHVPVNHQITFLRAIYGSLRNNGRLIVQVPNANSMFAAAWRYNDYTHTSSFTNVSLSFCLRNAGFERIAFMSDERLRRPSFRLWQSKARASWAYWLLDYFWRTAFYYQFGADKDTGTNLGINLLGYTDKRAA